MKNLKTFCEAITDFCQACDDQYCTYEIVKSDDFFDSDDFVLRVFPHDNIVGKALLSDIPSDLYYYFYITKDNRLCLIVR